MSKSDFFGDGNTDILFQNNDGSVALWDMIGATVTTAGVVAVNPGPTWDIEATAGGTAVTPGSGSFTDAAGNVFTITATGIAEENGLPVFDASGTAKLEYYEGSLYGQDATTGNWFRFVSDGSWAPSVAPGFFGDGNSDIVFQNNDGSIALWDMSGTSVIASGVVAVNPGPTWHVKGTGLFFGDGSTAIVFQNDDGSVALWDMIGTNVVASGVVAVNPGPTWHIEGVGDFYNDGNSDLLFQNDDGSVALWDMTGTFVFGAGVVAVNPGPTWQIKGVGDFFGDGNTDIVFQNNDGSVALWDMNGTNVVAAGVVAVNPGPTWHIKSTGAKDIVFQNDNGSVALWQMSGTNVIGAGVVAVNPGTAWNVLDDNLRFIYSTSANETLVATTPTPDEFVFTSFATGSHAIDGFNPVQDMIEFSGAQFPSFTDVQAATSAIAGGTMINLGNGSSLLLPGVDPGSLHASNFALA